MNHRGMKALAENAEAVRALAARLLQLPSSDTQVEWTGWEIDFLESMASRKGPEPLSLRQVEVLVGLEDRTRLYTSLDGLGIGSLLEACWLARVDLDEAGEQFVADLKLSGARTLRRSHALKLLACARQLGLVERYVDLAA